MMHTKKIGRVFHDQEGQSLMEYALILFLVFLVAIAVVVLIGNQVLALLQNFVNAF